MKPATNALLGVQVTALAEIIAFLKRNHADPAIAGTPVWVLVASYLTSTMLTGNFAPQFPVELIEKDFDYTLRAAGSPEAVSTIAAAHAVFEQALAKGQGAENMTRVVKLFTE